MSDSKGEIGRNLEKKQTQIPDQIRTSTISGRAAHSRAFAVL